MQRKQEPAGFLPISVVRPFCVPGSPIWAPLWAHWGAGVLNWDLQGSRPRSVAVACYHASWNELNKSCAIKARSSTYLAHSLTHSNHIGVVMNGAGSDSGLFCLRWQPDGAFPIQDSKQGKSRLKLGPEHRKAPLAVVGNFSALR